MAPLPESKKRNLEQGVRRNLGGDADAEDKLAAATLRYRGILKRNAAYPWNAPGMPGPGPNFIRVALELESAEDKTHFVDKTKNGKKIFEYKPSAILEKLYTRALRDPKFSLSVDMGKGTFAQVRFLPGHIWGTNYDRVQSGDEHFNPTSGETPVNGPVPAKVMVIGKCPNMHEQSFGANFLGKAAEAFVEALARTRIKNARDWYVTNLVKFPMPEGVTSLKSAWISDCLPLLQQEIRIVRPDYILCLGAQVVSAVLGKGYSVTNMAGRVVYIKSPIALDDDDPTPPRRIGVLAVNSPGDVVRDQSRARVLDSGLQRMYFVLAGGEFSEVEKGLDHRVVRTFEEAEAVLEQAEADCQKLPLEERLVAWDAEWQGVHPQDANAYLRTIQMSWADKKAAVFVTAAQGGAMSFVDNKGRPALRRLFAKLQDFMQGKRAVGHFLTADLEWAEYYGLDLIRDCPVPLNERGEAPGWQRLRAGEGWLDTAAMSHAIEETGALGLEVLTLRYTTAPPYHLKLDEWKAKQNKETKEGVRGYGNCPDDVLLNYALYDADVTRRIAVKLLPLIEKDYEGFSAWEALWETEIAMRVTHTMRKHGVLIDKNKLDQATKIFMSARSALEEKIRHNAKWPNLSLRSIQQAKEYLFGEHLNGTFDPETRKPVRKRPPGAVSLRLEPVLDTSKPPRRWADVVMQGLEHRASPSTGKLVLEILAREVEDEDKRLAVADFRDFRFLDQVLKSTLREPRTEEGEDDEYAYVVDDNGNMEYDGGLYEHICSDGRVRPTLLPTAETGRWKCRRPNLQNISKTRDDDYKRLLGPNYDDAKLRNILVASPGYAFVEADYKGAELLGMALLSGDQTMIEHATRALHPDEGYDEKGRPCRGGKFPHPDYYDIHSNVAVRAFRLTCAPTKAGLKSIGKISLRNAAKTVIFGVAYGRGAKAVALALREKGVRISVDEAQALINALFAMYPKLEPFFKQCQEAAITEGRIVNCFGRARRFPRTADRALQGEFGRQAQNFPIQSLVASAVDRAAAVLDKKIRDMEHEDDIRLVLQIHDALLLETRFEYVEYAAETLLPYAMVKSVPIYPTDVKGEPNGTGPFHFSIDVSVDKCWGKHFSLDECRAYGIPEKYAEK